MKKHWFRAVADRVTDPLLLLAPEGTVLACNPPARRVLGDDIEGRDLVELAKDADGFRRYLSLASRSSSSLPGSLRTAHPEAQYRCDASVAVIEDEKLVVLQLRSSSDTVRRFIALNEQIDRLQAEIRRRKALESEREQLLGSEQEARRTAEEASRFKDDLLASISHELRTPLHAISGWVALIRDTPDDRERLMRGLDVIERNVAAETQLTEDLVDTSLVVTGRMKLSIQHVDLEQVVRQAIESIQPMIEAKQQRLQVVADVGACVVNGDPDRLLQVVWNLLSNAAKYTPKGGRIQVLLRRINSHAEIVVSDNGDGMSKDLLPYVFDRFRRADASTTRRSGGLGLGLAIVRHLVELHGGVVMADSDGPGKGTTFTVNLPLPAFRHRSATAPRAAEPQHAEEAGVLAGLSVLLVEDHEDSREILTDILSLQGAAVHAAESSFEAQERLHEHPPHIVISDIEMPDEDGFTLMRKLRQLERELGRPSIPAIAVSAHSIGNARLHALRAGYQAFLSKPMKPAELVALVASLCQRHWGS